MTQPTFTVDANSPWHELARSYELRAVVQRTAPKSRTYRGLIFHSDRLIAQTRAYRTLDEARHEAVERMLDEADFIQYVTTPRASIGGKPFECELIRASEVNSL